MKTFLQRVLAKLSIFALMATSLFAFAPAHAAVITLGSNTLTRHKINIVTGMTIQFITPTGVETTTTDTITLVFSTNVDLAGLAFGDVDLAVGNSSCASFTDVNEVAASAGDNIWGFGLSSQTITLSPPTSNLAAISAGDCIQIQLGAVADGGTDTIENHTSAETPSLVVGGGFGDSGTISWAVVDDDQVNVTATVSQTMTFDLDDGETDGGETAATYDVAFGDVSTTAVNSSGSNDSVNAIFIDLDTNATGGAVVQVISLNGAMDSAVTSADTIASADGIMEAGTENYGICVSSLAQTSGALAKVAPFGDSPCALNSDVNDVGGVTTSYQDILNTGGNAIAGGRAAIAFSASVSATTAAHDDYADTLTFRATATF